MKYLTAVLLFLGLAPSAAFAARRTTLVELFTAQGCATCNKVNASVARFLDRPGVILLTWSVDYWDYLGWKDTFAEPTFADRQRAYDVRFGLRDVSTPQIIVGGIVQQSGDKADAVEDLLKRGRRQSVAPPQITVSSSGRIAVGSGDRPRGGGDVWLVRYSPTEPAVEVKEGDNRGATVSERNVVRQLVRLGTWSGRSKTYHATPAPEDGLSTVVIVQNAKCGPIIAVASPVTNR